jgi:hypothetical protein
MIPDGLPQEPRGSKTAARQFRRDLDPQQLRLLEAAGDPSAFLVRRPH